MDEPGGLILKRQLRCGLTLLRCGLGGRLLEWQPGASSREEREKRDAREMRNLKLDVRGSTFRTPRTSELEPALVPSISRGVHPD